MINTSYIMALSNSGFVVRQLTGVFDAGGRQARRASFRRNWGFADPADLIG